MKEFGIKSYSDNYETSPAFWIDAIEIIDLNIKKAQAWQQRNSQ